MLQHLAHRFLPKPSAFFALALAGFITAVPGLGMAGSPSPNNPPASQTAQPQTNPLADPRFKRLDSRDPAKVAVLGNVMEKGYRPRFLYRDEATHWDVWFLEQGKQLPLMVYTAPDECCIMGGHLYVRTTDGKLEYSTGQHFVDAVTVLTAEGKLSDRAAAEAATQAAMAQVSSGSAPQASQAGTPPAKLTASVMLDRFSKAAWIEKGSPSAPLMYVVVDPECGFCHQLTQTLLPFIEAGKVRLRMIMVTSQDPGNGGLSTSSALEIFSRKDAGSAWFEHLTRTSLPRDKRQPLSGDKVSGDMEPKLDANNQMRQDILVPNSYTAVPFIFYRNKDGKLGFVSTGIEPEKVPDLVQSITSVDQVGK